MLTSGSALDLTFSYLYYLWCPETNFHWEMRFLTQSRESYGKYIIILLRYKINQTETDTAGGSYSHKYNFKWPTAHFHVTDKTFHNASGYGHFTSYENYTHFIQAFTLGALHALCCLSCVSTLQVTSYHFHFAQ